MASKFLATPRWLKAITRSIRAKVGLLVFSWTALLLLGQSVTGYLSSLNRGDAELLNHVAVLRMLPLRLSLHANSIILRDPAAEISRSLMEHDINTYETTLSILEATGPVSAQSIFLDPMFLNRRLFERQLDEARIRDGVATIRSEWNLRKPFFRSLLGNANAAETYEVMEAQEELIDRSNRLSETIEIIMNEKLELIRWVNLLSIVAGLLLAGLFYFSLGKMIIHPVKRLKQATQLFTEGNRTVRADLQSDDELGNLSSTFNEFIVTVTRQEEELRLRFLEAMKNNQELERASKMKSQFLARMSHELRAPMNSIIGYSEVLLDELDGELNEEQKTDVRSVLKASEHLLRLINEILDLSKIEAGHMKVVLEAVRIRDVIRDVEATAEPLLRAKSLSWTVYGIEEDVTVRADRDRLRQMLLNLVSNAIKFTEKGGLTLRIEKDETKGIIEVEDTGIGIPEGEVERVFEEFHQVDGASNRRHGGTGLGLAIVRKFAELMNGRVSCRSAVEVGSVFRMELPLFTYRPDEGEENKTEVEE